MVSVQFYPVTALHHRNQGLLDLCQIGIDVVGVLQRLLREEHHAVQLLDNLLRCRLDRLISTTIALTTSSPNLGGLTGFVAASILVIV